MFKLNVDYHVNFHSFL